MYFGSRCSHRREDSAKHLQDYQYVEVAEITAAIFYA
jgi:hypothetical protein